MTDPRSHARAFDWLERRLSSLADGARVAANQAACLPEGEARARVELAVLHAALALAEARDLAARELLRARLAAVPPPDQRIPGRTDG